MRCRFCGGAVNKDLDLALALGQQSLLCARHMRLALQGRMGVALAGTLAVAIWRHRRPVGLSAEQARQQAAYVEQLMRMDLRQNRFAVEEQVPRMTKAEWSFVHGLLHALSLSHPRAKLLREYAQSLRGAERPPEPWLSSPARSLRALQPAS